MSRSACGRSRVSPEAKCEKLRTELSRMFGMRAVMLFLSQFGGSAPTSVAIWKRWGTLSQKMIEENPYLLCCDEIGMDFDSCEMIARKLNILPDSSYRIEGCLHRNCAAAQSLQRTYLPAGRQAAAHCRAPARPELHHGGRLEELLRRREVLVVDVNGRGLLLPFRISGGRAIYCLTGAVLLAAGADPIPQSQQKLEQLEQSGGIQYAALSGKQSCRR